MTKKDENIDKWINKADQDFKVSFLALDSPEASFLSEVICFHAQQAVEKLLKAFCIANDIKFPFTHDLIAILQLVESKISVSYDVFHWCETLTEYGVRPRYPTDDEQISLEEAKEALDYAVRIKNFILPLIET